MRVTALKTEALRLVLRALGVKKVTPLGGALLVVQFLGVRARERRERRERARRWAQSHRIESAA